MPYVRIICLLLTVISQTIVAKDLQKGFVYLKDVEPTIIQEMRYAGHHNFTGKPVPGYIAAQCILTKEAATVLKKVQAEVQRFGMTLKVYDCYRPQRAVDSFVAWAQDISDKSMKKEFFPNVDKRNLFKEGYIAEKSGHSRGSTVDLAIVSLPIPQQAEYQKGQALVECTSASTERFKDNSLDFGTGWDCFDPLSHMENSKLGLTQKRNRLMLKSLMEKFGFKHYAYEWWHFTLADEPYPDQYFNFLVQ